MHDSVLCIFTSHPVLTQNPQINHDFRDGTSQDPSPKVGLGLGIFIKKKLSFNPTRPKVFRKDSIKKFVINTIKIKCPTRAQKFGPFHY
jgi:hypothetical protein